MKLIAQGAEAKLYRENATIIKERLAKAYRHPELDESLRQFRTRREAKVLQKLEDLQFPAPHLREFSDKRMSIVMDFVPGNTLKEVAEKIGTEFAEDKNKAKIWGSGAKFPGQEVSLTTPIRDGMQIRFL